MSRFFGFVFATCLLAIWTSTTVPAANPDWPKSLSLAVASPGGVSYDYGEALAKILTESLKIDVNPMPTQGPVHMVKLIESGGAQLGFHHGRCAAGLERHRRLDCRSTLSQNAGTISDVRPAIPLRHIASVKYHDGCSVQQSIRRHRAACGNRWRLCSGNARGHRDIAKVRQWIVGHRSI
jgi:hypothetical protein